MKWKLRNLEKSLLFIQHRFLRRRTTHEAKLQILENYWNKFLGQLYFENLNIGDQKTREMVAGIIRVRKEISCAVLTKYLHKCGQLHSLAFFQWRYKFPSNIWYKTRQIQDVIFWKTKRVYDNVFWKQKNKKRTTWEMDDFFFEKYQKIITEHLGCNISTFKQIGLHDPFPKEIDDIEFQIPHCYDDYVYSPSRYVYGSSPKHLYIPSRRMMLKLMRACIGIEHEKDLWYHTEPPAKRAQMVRQEMSQ